MQRGVIAKIFAGHRVTTIRLDEGELFTVELPSLDKIEAYMKYRESIGKPVDYQME